MYDETELFIQQERISAHKLKNWHLGRHYRQWVCTISGI